MGTCPSTVTKEVWHIHNYDDPDGEQCCFPTFDSRKDAEKCIADVRAMAVREGWGWPSLAPVEGNPPAPAPAMGDVMGEHVYNGGWSFPDR
jgi:hypothetical protein